MEFPDAIHVRNLTGTGRLRDLFCTPLEDSGFYSRGIWFDEDPLGQLMPITFFQLSLFFVISHSLYFIFRALHVPKIVCNVAAGIIMGPSGLGRYNYFAVRFHSARHFLLMNTLASFGAFLDVFIIAVKLDLGMLTRMGKNGQRIGVSCLIFPFVVITSLMTILRPVLPNELPRGALLILFAANSSGSAFINLIPILQENKLLSTELAQLAMSASVLNDSFLWFFWTVMMFLRLSSLLQCASAAMLLAALISFGVFIFRPAMIWIIHRTPEGEPVKDTYIVIILLLVLLSGLLSDCIGPTPLLGALVLGLVTPDGPPLASTLMQTTDMILQNFFSPFLYLSVGAAADISSTYEWKQLLMFQAVILAGYFAKLLGAMLPALRSGMSPRHALTIGLMLNTKGVIELLVYRLMVLRKALSVPLFTQLVCSSMALTAIVVPLVKILYRAPLKSERESLRGYGLTIQSTLLASEMRILLCIHTENDVPAIIDLVEASHPTESSPIRLYMIHLMELVGRNAPSLTPHLKHDTTCKRNGCLRIFGAFKNYLTSLEGEVTIQPFSMVALHKSMHEGICRLAHDRKVPLIIVPFLARNHSHVEASAGLSKLNSNVQAYAQCTVGILVDRATHSYRSHQHFHYHVAVVFIGGQDDREALALAVRMSCHPGVTITLFRVIIRNERFGNKRGSLMDSAAVDDFRTKNFGNERVHYREIGVEDWDHTLKAIKCIGDCYNLIIVGKQQRESGLQEEEMAIWIENPELGMLGDILVSSDFYGGTVSVLVMQHYRNANSSAFGNSMRVDEER
ncbi:hypothetical protein Dimus_033429 [Dionaea muscipula]